MTFVQAGSDKIWHVRPNQIECGEVIEMTSGSTFYVNVDFSAVLNRLETLALVSVATLTERDSKTIGLSGQDVSEDKKKISFLIDPTGGAGDYVIQVPATTNIGGSDVLVVECILRVV